MEHWRLCCGYSYFFDCYLTLVIVSLLISILLEMIKKIMGYTDWFEKITNKIVSFLAY